MGTVRDFLNELTWREGRDLAAARIWYVHRGVPGDRRVVRGARVRDLGHSFMEIDGPKGGTMIPYHRITRVEVDDRVAWRRQPPPGRDAG